MRPQSRGSKGEDTCKAGMLVKKIILGTGWRIPSGPDKPDSCQFLLLQVPTLPVPEKWWWSGPRRCWRRRRGRQWSRRCRRWTSPLWRAISEPGPRTSPPSIAQGSYIWENSLVKWRHTIKGKGSVTHFCIYWYKVVKPSFMWISHKAYGFTVYWILKHNGPI